MPSIVEETAVEEEQQHDDTVSTYTNRRRSHQLPAYAARSVSSGSSQRNTSILSIASHDEIGSSSNILTEEAAIPPWKSSANSCTSDCYSEEQHLHPDITTTTSRMASTSHQAEVEDDGMNGETMSILTTVEQHVLAGLTQPNVNNNAHMENSDADDFLKVNHESYLSSVANVVDIVSIISYWIDVVMISFFDQQPWSVFQALGATRLLRILVITEGTTVIMASLRSSYDMLKNVIGFFIFFWLLFSLVGLFIFMNAFGRRCAIVPEGRPLAKNMSGNYETFTFMQIAAF